MLDFGWVFLLHQSKTMTSTGMYIYVSICLVGEGGNLRFASHVRYSTACVSAEQRHPHFSTLGPLSHLFSLLDTE